MADDGATRCGRRRRWIGRAGGHLAIWALAAGCAASGRMDPMEDAALTARVKRALLNDAVVGRYGLDVDTVGRVVTLTGRVHTREDEAHAMAVARTVTGVLDVRTRLLVLPPEGASRSPVLEMDPVPGDPEIVQQYRDVAHE